GRGGDGPGRGDRSIHDRAPDARRARERDQRDEQADDHEEAAQHRERHDALRTVSVTPSTPSTVTSVPASNGPPPVTGRARHTSSRTLTCPASCPAIRCTTIARRPTTASTFVATPGRLSRARTQRRPTAM